MLYNEKRPHIFDEMVGQKHIVDNLRNQSIENRWFQVYILAGQFGGGKTTMARIIALASNCKCKDDVGNPCLECEDCKSILSSSTTDVVEIDAASNTGVDSIRELKERTGYKPLNLSKKIYIIDEVHMLSKQAFNALLKMLEEPPENTIFIMCTTELKAIPATVRSRSATYIFEQISFTDILEKIEDVVKEKSFNISRDALVLIAKNAQGSMRNAYSLLEQVTSGSEKEVVADDVQNLLGISDPTHLFELLSSIIKAEPGECILSLEKAVSLGKDMSLMVNDMIDIIANAIIAKSASIDLIHETEQYKDLLSRLIESSYLEQLCHIADGLMDIRVDLRRCPEKTTVAVGIIRITASSINKTFISRLERVEEILKNGLDVSSISVHDKVSKVCEYTDNEQASPLKENMSQPPQPVDVVEEVYYEDKDKVVAEALANEDDNMLEDGNADEIGSNPVAEEEADDAEAFVDTEEFAEEVSHDNCFDVFSMLEQFNTISSSSSMCTGMTQEESVDVEDRSAKQKRLEERLRLASEGDSVFTTSIMGCVKSMKDGKLVLITPLKPVYDILETYISVSEIKEIEIEYDPLVSLS